MDSLWDATRGFTPGKSAADQVKRSVLLTRIGVMMARSSKFKPVPKLMEWQFGSLRGEVSSTGSRRKSRPTLGLDLCLIGRCRSQVGAQCGWFTGLGVVGVGWPCSIRVPVVGRNGR